MNTSERDEYRGDVWYSEWCRGLPEGSVSDDEIELAYDAGQSPQSLVDIATQRLGDEWERRLYEQQTREEYDREMQEEYYDQPDDPTSHP